MLNGKTNNIRQGFNFIHILDQSVSTLQKKGDDTIVLSLLIIIVFSIRNSFRIIDHHSLNRRDAFSHERMAFIVNCQNQRDLN